MKKLPLFVALFVASTSVAFGQSYRADNFDFVSGINVKARVETPVAKRTQGGSHHALGSGMNAMSHPRASAFTTTQSLGGYTTGNAAIDGLIVESGRSNAVDPLLLYSI